MNKQELIDAIAGFGSFSVIKRKARPGRNPQTGKEIKIKARKVPNLFRRKISKIWRHNI